MEDVLKVLNRVLVWTFIFTCKMINKINDMYNHLYNTNEDVRNFVSFLKFTYNAVTFQPMEPLNSPWISKSWIDDSLYEQWSFIEKYKTNFEEIDLSSISLYEMTNIYFKLFCKACKHRNTSLFTMKLLNSDNDECYFVRKGDAQNPFFSFEKSAAKFLSIEYTHPEMDNSIELSLDKSFLHVGNELFSSTFIWRALKYQSQKYVFDVNYKISIMDKDLQFIEFGNDKFILLTEDGYEVVNCQKDNDNDNDSEMPISDTLQKTFELCGVFLNDIQ